MQDLRFPFATKCRMLRYMMGTSKFLKSFFNSSYWNVDRSDPNKYISGLNSVAIEGHHITILSRVLSN